MDLEIRMLDLVAVRRGAGRRLAMRGTVGVTSGQETVVDFPVPFAAVS